MTDFAGVVPYRGGGHVKIDRDGPYAVLVFGLLGFLVVTSFARHVRRRRRWEKRQHVKRYDRPDDPPASTDIEPLEVRAEGPPKTMIVLGDDDDQFRLRVRPGVTLVLPDGGRGTLREGTPLKCTFPGFSIVIRLVGDCVPPRDAACADALRVSSLPPSRADASASRSGTRGALRHC